MSGFRTAVPFVSVMLASAPEENYIHRSVLIWVPIFLPFLFFSTFVSYRFVPCICFLYLCFKISFLITDIKNETRLKFLVELCRMFDVGKIKRWRKKKSFKADYHKTISYFLWHNLMTSFFCLFQVRVWKPLCAENSSCK